MALTDCCWLTKLLFLLLLMSRALNVVDTRPARGSPISDLIAGNEFLKLFMERNEMQRELHSDEYQGDADGTGAAAKSTSIENVQDNFDDDGRDGTSSVSKQRNGERSLDHKTRSGSNANQYDTAAAATGDDNNDYDDDESKRVVKLVTSGSKIVFLEEYDDADDAIVDAVARDIDLKREKVKNKNHKTNEETRIYQESKPKTANGDEFKVVAVSVSSSSKRGSPNTARRPPDETPKQVSKFMIKAPSLVTGGQPASNYLNSASTRPTTKSTTTTTTTTTAARATTSTTTPSPTKVTATASITATNDIADDFINRSHKSEFSIEEAEPLTMPQKQHKTRRAHAVSDSENSASTNVKNVLASPRLITSASVRSSSVVPASVVNRNSTQSHNPTRQTRINQSRMTYDDSAAVADASGDTAAGTDTDGELAEEKLLPFQTVIYHDTKEGHGPQSRSISYSSISQNVDDLQAWQRTGILAEAQHNVSESLKPIARAAVASQAQQTQKQIQTHPHESEPAKFYSVPAKMYSVPSKFYSEPSKVYSQPAKVYGEPAKIYSQPAKVYGEPAKTYWPQSTSITTATTSTSSTTTTMTPASQSIITTFAPFAAPFNLTSRRPAAIVSRIAFGEAQGSTSSPAAAVNDASLNFGHRTQNYPHYLNQHHHQIQQQQQQQQQHRTHQSVHETGQNTQSRRVLFNLDKLPYDLLNAPEQHLLEPDSSKSQASPCGESSAIASSLSVQPQHSRQHSSFLDQHSNQNAKGLPNRDLVKCVTKYSPHHSSVGTESAARRPPSSSSLTQHQQQHQFTTERSLDELYQPTPEQNYEIEESVSVMTNGRAHGVQGNVGGGTMTTTVLPPKTKSTRGRFYAGDSTGGLRSYGQSSAKTNVANLNGDVENNADGPPSPRQYNKNRYHNNNNNSNNNDYNYDTGDADDTDANDGGNGDDDDDSKVAYVVEGRNYRKYRVEEKTDDGFIVGEFGVVDHNDGNLRGVRYTADSTINPSLIQKALLTFLKLK